MTRKNTTKKTLPKVCAICSKAFLTWTTMQKQKTCSKECGGLYRRKFNKETGRRHSSWKTGFFINKSGYKMVRHKQWYGLEHRILMSKEIGRELTKKEVVHHWDEDKVNNERTNLALFRHHGAHKRLHLFATRHGIPIKDLWFSQDWLSVTP